MSERPRSRPDYEEEEVGVEGEVGVDGAYAASEGS